MEPVLEFILLVLTQFAGGPGPVENNLVRFGLPAILWGILFYIAWTRQRTQKLPREKLLMWGFGLALVRELYMFGQMSYRLLGSNAEAKCDVIQPLEHALAMAAMIVVAGAFLLFILQDPKFSNRYLLVGLGITVLVFFFTSWFWPRQLAAYPQLKFHQTWAAWLFHVPLSALMAIAIFMLLRKRGWLRNVVASALILYLLSEVLLLINYSTGRAFNAIFCPIGNSLHILAIPLLGYVYLREQSLEKKQADESLAAYRDHLEELVDQRTNELTTVNTQLKQEILDRTRVEEALERITRRYELILESAGEGICEIDREGRFIFATPAAARLLGYSAEELIDRSSHAIWHPTTSSGAPHSLADCPIYQGYAQGIQRFGDDETFWRRDDTKFPVRYFSNPVQEKDELTGAVVVFHDITERKRSETEIAQRNASLATQIAVAATLSQSLEIEENLKQTLEMVRAEVEVEFGLIFLLDQDNDHLRLYLSGGKISPTAVQACSAEKSACVQISRRALLNLLTVTASLDDMDTDGRETENNLTGIHRLISVPLVSKGRAVGAMTMGSRHATAIQAHQLELLTAIGQQIGMAIENARLYQVSEDWAMELTRLHQASSTLSASFDMSQVTAEIARQSAWLLKCPKACVIQLNGQTGQLELASDFGLSQDELGVLHSKLLNWDINTIHYPHSRTFAVRDISTEGNLSDDLIPWLKAFSALVVPIWTSEKRQDFILLLDAGPERQWHGREIELIESLANRAAVAMVNADLHQQLELAAALQERQRIAANMHDGLAQTLSLLGLKVDRMQELVEGESEEVEDAVNGMREAVTQALVEVRRSITTLQETPGAPYSLQDIIHDLVARSRTTEGPQLKLDLGPFEKLFISSEQTDQVLRIIQESIANARHHAQARTIRVRLEKLEAKIQITIEDDGCGFDLNAPRQTKDHFGLSIMQARAARIGGDLQIDTSPGKGTRVTISWAPESQDCSRYTVSN